MNNRLFRVGTRSSALALWQTHFVIQMLKETYPHAEFEVVEMSTKGDEILNQSLVAIGDKGLFTKSLEDAMLNGTIDFAVHSLKDMPTVLPKGLALTAMTARQDPRDALLSKCGDSIEALPKGAVVGTSSLRRKAQLLARRPDLQVVDLRGNVQTRIKKYLSPDFDAAILATVGLERMDLDSHISQRLDTDDFVPAVGQGIIVVESRKDDMELIAMLQAITSEKTWQCAMAERAFMRTLEGGCQVPVGAYATITDNVLTLTGLIASLDGTQTVKKEMDGEPENAEHIGIQLAQDMLKDGGQVILDAIRGEEHA